MCRPNLSPLFISGIGIYIIYIYANTSFCFNDIIIFIRIIMLDLNACTRNNGIVWMSHISTAIRWIAIIANKPKFKLLNLISHKVGMSIQQQCIIWRIVTVCDWQTQETPRTTIYRCKITIYIKSCPTIFVIYEGCSYKILNPSSCP